MHGQSIIGTGGCLEWHGKKVNHVRICTIIHLKGVNLIQNRLLFRLVQEPSFRVVPRLRYGGRSKCGR